MLPVVTSMTRRSNSSKKVRRVWTPEREVKRGGVEELRWVFREEEKEMAEGSPWREACGVVKWGGVGRGGVGWGAGGRGKGEGGGVSGNINI